MILCEHELINPSRTAAAVRQVWAERNGELPPRSLPAFPGNWPTRYEHLAHAPEIAAITFPAAVAVVTALWREIMAS